MREWEWSAWQSAEVSAGVCTGKPPPTVRPSFPNFANVEVESFPKLAEIRQKVKGQFTQTASI